MSDTITKFNLRYENIWNGYCLYQYFWWRSCWSAGLESSLLSSHLWLVPFRAEGVGAGHCACERSEPSPRRRWSQGGSVGRDVVRGSGASTSSGATAPRRADGDPRPTTTGKAGADLRKKWARTSGVSHEDASGERDAVGIGGEAAGRAARPGSRKASARAEIRQG